MPLKALSAVLGLGGAGSAHTPGAGGIIDCALGSGNKAGRSQAWGLAGPRAAQGGAGRGGRGGGLKLLLWARPCPLGAEGPLA